MKRKHSFVWRYTVLGVFMALICLVYIGRLVNVQIASRSLYIPAMTNTHTRTVKMQALRGEIYDRNGKPLVTNDITYDFVFDYAALPQNRAAANDVILAALEALAVTEDTDRRLPDSCPLTGSYPNFSYDTELLARTSTRFAQVLAENELDAEIGAGELGAHLAKKYRMLDSEGEPLYSAGEMTELIRIRYDMEYLRFSYAQPYVLAEDVSLTCITYVRERELQGADFLRSATRLYHYPGYASHILGRVGKIQRENLEYYNELGYPMDATVGISGCEQAFESYLRGVDGVLTIVEDADGNLVDRYVSTEPVAGKNIRLTIDMDMQIAAEDALAANIAYIVEKAESTPGEHDGEDASCGALTAVGVSTGEIYAIASNPTYNLATFSADFASLNTDERTPMVNRALMGMYPPGSIFKIGVAAAALSEGIITPETTITDRGIYEYYAPSYTPRCWIYLRYGWTHGTVNVVKALQVSCNYFFYDVGRQLGIDAMNRYMRVYGLGEATGVELAEKTGILAGPAYRELNGRPWSAGDTIQAAIGQSDNAFTPLQLSVYTSTIANGGTRYAAHLLHSVRAYDTDEIIYAPTPTVISEARLSDYHHETLMTALKSVTEDDGSAARIFSDYPITVGGKTGTAQVSKQKSDNAVFTAFAPWDNPEIAVSCVIEQGSNGTDAGLSVRRVFDYYFKLGDYAPAPAEGGQGES